MFPLILTILNRDYRTPIIILVSIPGNIRVGGMVFGEFELLGFQEFRGLLQMQKGPSHKLVA